MATETLTADRRSFLSGAGAIAAIAAMPAFAATSPRSAWNAAMARLQAAAHVLSKCIKDHSILEREYFDALPPQPSGVVMFKDGRSFTMEEAMANAEIRKAAWKEQRETLRARFKIEESEQRQYAACSVHSDALDDLMDCPAPDGAALIRKIELVREHELDFDLIIADVRHLMGGA